MPTINKKRYGNNQPKAIHHKQIQRKAVYNTITWQRLRKIKFAQNPLCELCLKNNIVKPAVDIHHIKTFVDAPQNEIYALAYDIDNLQSLCKECHQLIHNKKIKPKG